MNTTSSNTAQASNTRTAIDDLSLGLV